MVMEHLRQDPESVLYALDVIAQSNALLAKLCVTEAGCDGVYYCVQGGEKERFTHEEYRRLITPSDKYVLEQVNQVSNNNILHCCGWAGIANHLENWQDYPAKAVNWAVYIEERHNKVPAPATGRGFCFFRQIIMQNGCKNRLVTLFLQPFSFYAGPLFGTTSPGPRT